jgi:uncharacterized protein (DUF58 family)
MLPVRATPPTRPRGALVPSPVLVALAVAPLALAIATLVDPTLLWVMFAVDGGLVLVAAADALMARPPLVTVRRETARVFSIGRRNIVTLRVASTASRGLRVRITDDVFDSATAEDIPTHVDLPARGRAQHRYAVIPSERGEHALGDHWVRYRSPLQLWIRQLRIPAHTVVQVYPDVQLVRTYERLAGQDRGGTMVQSRPRRGGESEFEQLRDYIPGDAYRSIDWKATARRGKLVSREYQLERDQHLLLAIDTGRLLTAETDGISLFDHALNATLMLAHIASRGGDRVGLLTFDSEIRTYVPPAAGARVMQQIIRSSYAVHPRLHATDFEQGLSWLSAKVRKRTLVVLFTQVNDQTGADELIRMSRQLLPRHLPVVVIFRDVDIDALAEVRASSALDDYTAGAAAELLSWRDAVLARLRAAGIIVVDVRPGELTPRLVNTYLDVKARHLL